MINVRERKLSHEQVGSFDIIIPVQVCINSLNIKEDEMDHSGPTQLSGMTSFLFVML